MRKNIGPLQGKHRNIILLSVMLVALAGVTPVLAEYLGPDRTKVEITSTCKVILKECQDTAKGWKFHQVDNWSCSNEAKPWKDYPSDPPSSGCNAGTAGSTYWDKVDELNEVTVTYPPATISGTLQSCTLYNGWCTTPAQLSLSGNEPVQGYTILALEGTRNGQIFSCPGSSCSVPLVEGNNSFTYWALSSFADTSTMGTLAAKVDSQQPIINGTLSGTRGSNGWYVSFVDFNGSASDATSGLAKLTCSLDGSTLASCNSISVKTEGRHTLVLTAQDAAGHTRTLTQNIPIDTKKPVLNASINGAFGSNNWYTAATLNSSATDTPPGSGLSTFEYKLDDTAWKTFPAAGVLSLPDGVHTLTIQAKDNAGLITSSSKSYSLDSVAPSIAVDPVGTLGADNWYVSTLTLAASPADEISGVSVFEYNINNNSWTTYTGPLILADGIHGISFWAEDEAGLVTQMDSVYKVDSRPPDISGNLSGTPGDGDWFISDVFLSASASDPMPGSGIEAFTYLLDGGPETVYTENLSLPDGEHTIQFRARDKAGLSSTMDQVVQVDTTLPSLNIQTTLADWIKDNVTLSGTAEDLGSGLSKIEISTDGEQTWQPANGTTTWDYSWNTSNEASGQHDITVRVLDNAGLATTQTLKVGVDNNAPEISLPELWYQWDEIALDIRDAHSGLAHLQLEISDPEGRWPARMIDLNTAQFPMQFKWDRRFADVTIAPAGLYNVKVTASDQVGNFATRSASIRVLLDILPPGPTATPQPTATPTFPSTVTSRTPVGLTSTSPVTPLTPVQSTYTPTVQKTPPTSPNNTSTRSAAVRVFGSPVQPQASPTPTLEATLIPRAKPLQTNVQERLESVFVPDSNSNESKTETITLGTVGSRSQASDLGSNILWGAAAAAMVGSMTAYALEEKRRKEEERAEQIAAAGHEEERRLKIKAQKMEKLEAKWAQERAWEEARQEREDEKKERNRNRWDDVWLEHSSEAEEGAKWYAAQDASRERHEERKRAAEEKKEAEELQAGLAAYYNAMKQGEKTTATQSKEKPWWQKAWNGVKDAAGKTVQWIDQHQQEIALGIGVAVGVGAIIASGGLATPLVALAWTAGAATVAVGATAVGTVALNKHYGRQWNENLLKNVAFAGVAAAVVTGGWFALQAASTGIGAYCAVNQATCTRVEPLFNAVDVVEETSLGAKLAVQTWREDQVGAAETALELQMEHLDGGMPGNAIAKEIGGETFEKIANYGDEALDLVTLYGVDAAQIILKYEGNGIAVLQKYGKDAVNLVNRYDDYAIKVLNVVDPEKATNLLKTLDDDVLDYALEQGPDAVDALSRWNAKDLAQHGQELALRAKKDADVLADVKKLIASNPIDPAHLTNEQRALINEIAANSTFYSDEGQVVVGKWVDIGSGFVERAKDTGSVHYNPHPEMWNILGKLGKKNQDEVAWLVNQQVIRTGINKGLPFEYTLNGIPTKNIGIESETVETIFEGAPDSELMETLGMDYLPTRMKELQELQRAGYEYYFDEITNSYIFSLP